MTLLERLRAWWRRRAWSRRDGSTDAGEAATGYECAVCGTGVDDPGSPCPLCRASDVVPPGADSSAGGNGGESSDGETGAVSRDRRRVPAADDESVERLRTLREEGELLERYGDRWRRVDGGFRVETDRGTREVDTRAEVVALLRAEDGRRPPRS